ncbi:PE family protein [Nocardia sp. CA-107356]|uniref:PE family protein n=1 Tax=Nocardia sp. CA-107356 TaxID=3239972 RepID=UPI003D93E1CA
MGGAFDGVRFDPVAVRSAATQLDELAERLNADLQTEHPTLAVRPAGADEVSQRASQTLTGVAGSFHQSAADGILEMRKLAAALRAQCDNFGQMEDANVTGFGSH